MSDINIRIEGHAGRITLKRPTSLNALTWDMCLKLEAALDIWAKDQAVRLVIIDAAGDKAFCAGGDIAEMYTRGLQGDFAYGERFWRDEYRMVAKLFGFPKPVVTFLQGLTLGGGVGVGCHGSHRIVCEGSQIALPEVAIGLVPDVGGSLILARAPGRLGEYLGLTGAHMDAGSALLAGFADYYVPRAKWAKLCAALIDGAELKIIDEAAQPAPPSALADLQPLIDAHFGGETLGDIWRALPAEPQGDLATIAAQLAGPSPLAQVVALGLIRKVRAADNIEVALRHEFAFTSRAMEHGDFLEGIRAAIIDRDKTPKWRHASWHDVSGAEALRMTYPAVPPLDFTGETK